MNKKKKKIFKGAIDGIAGLLGDSFEISGLLTSTSLAEITSSYFSKCIALIRRQ